MSAFVQQLNTIKKQRSNSPVVFLILILLHHHVASNPKKMFISTLHPIPHSLQDSSITMPFLPSNKIKNIRNNTVF